MGDKQYFKYILKITLKHSKPPIWRRVSVPDTLTLGDLHDVIQIVMGWEDCHLHDFRIDDQLYGVKFDDDEDSELWGDEVLDENSVVLKSVLSEGQSFEYQYDFGDSWIHVVKVEKIEPTDASTSAVVVCQKGTRACPPEDCGGIYGYAHMLAVLNDPEHPEREDILEWLPEGFDASLFDIKQVNAQLAQARWGII